MMMNDELLVVMHGFGRKNQIWISMEKQKNQHTHVGMVSVVKIKFGFRWKNRRTQIRRRYEFILCRLNETDI